jgi:hypothetical protein
VISDRILKWSKKDGFYKKGLFQTYNLTSFGKPRTKIISGLYNPHLLGYRVSSVKFDGSGSILMTPDEFNTRNLSISYNCRSGALNLALTILGILKTKAYFGPIMKSLFLPQEDVGKFIILEMLTII